MFHTIKQGTLEYLTADALTGSIHCFSTRFGGVSEGHLASLNLGTHRGDAPENVYENYRILGAAVGFAPEQTVFTKQEHTDTILRVGKSDCGTGLSREQTVVCDGLITDEPGVALCCFGADCTTILLFDPATGALGAVHSGWRGTAMGMAGIVMAAGPAIGPVVGGLVIDGFGWRPMFIGIAVVALVILVGGTMMLKNVSELKNPKLNVLSVILSTIAFGGLLYGFSSASTMGWASPVVITSIVVGLVAFVAFVYKQVKLDEPLLRVDTLATRNFRNSAILVTLINAAVAATNVTLPIFIQNVLGQSATVTGMVMLPAAAVGIILSPVAGAAFDKFGPRGVGIGGLALMSISLGLLGTINTRTSVLFVAVFCALQASGQAIANMPINTWGVNALPNDMIAHGNAIANTGRQIAAAIATSLLVTAETSVTASHMSQGVKSATASGIAFSYLLCAAISLVALIICIFTVTSRAKEKAARNAKAYEAQASAEVAAETTEGQPAEHHYAGAYVAPASSLFKQTQEQSISGIMDDHPYSCLDSDDITHVVREFIRLNVSSLPVVNGDGRLVGFVSDGDVMKSIATYESRTVSTGTGSTMVVFDDETVASKVQALSGKKVMDIATRKVVAATPDQQVGEVARILAKKQFKKLPVVDGDGRLVGVIRRKSVMEHAFDALFPKDDR